MQVRQLCNSHVQALVVNVQDNKEYCIPCAQIAMPTFVPHYVLTLNDVRFMRACGVDPEIRRIEDYFGSLKLG
jgi:hypothetical protein